MKNKMIKRVFILIIILFCITILMYLCKCYSIHESLTYFEKFYSKNELDILKSNIIPMRKTVKSSNYQVSLKGAWAQENSVEFVFDIHPFHGNVVVQNNLQCFIRNAKEANDENGSLSLGAWEYQADSKDNGILKARSASEDPYKSYYVRIEIGNEQFVFNIPGSNKEKLTHFTPAEDSDNGSFREIYLSSIAVYWVNDDDNLTIPGNEICIKYANGTKQKMALSDGYVSQKDENITMHIQFLNGIYNMDNIETIYVGNEKYNLCQEE